MDNKLNMHYFVKIYAPEIILTILKMNPDFAPKTLKSVFNCLQIRGFNDFDSICVKK